MSPREEPGERKEPGGREGGGRASDARRADVCVVGAGPAGLTLALLMVRSGARVTVLERSRSLDRAYRGEILQPGGQRLLDSLGVLAGAKRRGCHEHGGFRLEERGKVLIDGDYRRLAGPYNCLLSIPQRHLLAELLERCRAYPGFEYVEGAKVTGLLEEGGAVRGVTCRAAGDRPPLEVRALCVVGADGRFSTVRRLAGLVHDRLDLFDQDVLWFRLAEPALENVRIFRAGGSPLLAYTSFPDSVQLGWTLPHGGYPAMASQGFAHVKEQLRRAAPHYADAIDAQLRGFGDVSLLDVFAGSVRRWARDGLLLIGDSAHTHSPIGAQGINLAIQDAVAAHPALCEGIRRGAVSEALLAPFTAQRARDIRSMTRIQVMQSRMMLSRGRVSSMVRPRAAALVSRTPAYRSLLRRIAFGNEAVEVRSDLFREEESTAA